MGIFHGNFKPSKINVILVSRPRDRRFVIVRTSAIQKSTFQNFQKFQNPKKKLKKLPTINQQSSTNNHQPLCCGLHSLTSYNEGNGWQHRWYNAGSGWYDG